MQKTFRLLCLRIIDLADDGGVVTRVGLVFEQ